MKKRVTLVRIYPKNLISIDSICKDRIFKEEHPPSY